MRTKRIKRQWMYILSFIACILVVNVGDMIISHADEVDIAVRYRTYTNESGWQDDAEQAGDNAEGSTEALTGLKMMITVGEDDAVNGNVKYSVYSKEANWSETVEAGSKASSGDNPIKAVKVELTENLVNEYDIEYRACNSNNEWMTWSKNGAVVGNIDGDANLVAIQAKIVKKQEVATPVENATTYDGVLIQDMSTPQQSTPEVAVTTPEAAVTTPEAAVTTPETPTVSSGSIAMEAFYNMVVSQIGQGRNSAGNTTYGEWWAARVNNSAFKDAKWCAMFLSWCANQSGIAEKTIGYFAACSHWQDNFKAQGRWHEKSGYTPVKGDLIFFDYDGDGSANHNGIVESVSDTKVVAVEGNVNDLVARVEYDINDSTIIGYGSPDYEKNAENLEAEVQQQQQQQQQEETGASAPTSTGQASKMIEVAASQIGTKESSNGWTKYGEWYENNIDGSYNFSNAHWCAMFVTWCANEVGVARDVIKPYAACAAGVSNFKNQGVWHNRSGYTPKTGDIIFFTYSHTGIVEKVQDGYVHTIEGNTSNACKRRQHAIGSSQIKGYGSPKYN